MSEEKFFGSFLRFPKGKRRFSPGFRGVLCTIIDFITILKTFLTSLSYFKEITSTSELVKEFLTIV